VSKGEGQDPKRKEFLDRFDKLRSSEMDSAKSFDQALLTLSAGALALSLTFIKEVAPKPVPGSVKWLGIAWFAFAVATLAILFSFLYAQLITRERRNKLSEAHGYPPEAPADRISKHQRPLLVRLFGPGDPFGEAIDCLNWWSIIAFVIGVVCLVVFCLFNVQNGESTVPENPRQSQSGDAYKAFRETPNPPPEASRVIQTGDQRGFRETANPPPPPPPAQGGGANPPSKG
jgi:hypothetical protein